MVSFMGFLSGCRPTQDRLELKHPYTVKLSSYTTIVKAIASQAPAKRFLNRNSRQFEKFWCNEIQKKTISDIF